MDRSPDETRAVFMWVAPDERSAKLGGEVTFGPGDHVVGWSHGVDIAQQGGGVVQWWPLVVALAAVAAVTVGAALRGRRPHLS